MGRHALTDSKKQETVWQMRARLLPDVNTWVAWSDEWNEAWIHSWCLCGYSSGGLYYLDGSDLYKQTMQHFGAKHNCIKPSRKMIPSHTLKAAARRHRERIYYDFH